MAAKSLPPADAEMVFDALWGDDCESLQELLREHTVPFEFEESGLSPLSVAAVVGERCYRYLLEHGANPNLFNLDGTTPLFIALRNENEASSALLLKWGAKAYLDHQQGRTPPMNWVCERGLLGQLTLLLETLSEDDRTACFLQLDYLGLTPIHQAARNGFPELIRKLFQYGCDLNSRSYIEGKTPLHCACEEGQGEAIETLFDFGADVETRDLHNRQPVDYLESMATAKLPIRIYKKLLLSQTGG